VEATLFAEIRNAIAHIRAGPSRGTGFLVAPDLLLTAFHVVGERSRTPPELFSERVVLEFPGDPAADGGIPSSAGPSLQVAGTVHESCFDPQADWALIRVQWKERENGARWPLRMAELRQDDNTWWTFGFPEFQPDGVKSKGEVRDWNASLGGAPALQLYCVEAAAGKGAPVPGYSGSPVLIDEDKGPAVVGVLRAAICAGSLDRTEAGTLYACPVSRIWESVEKVVPGLLPKLALLEISKLAAPHQLPPPPERFEGRQAELGKLRVASNPAGVTFVAVQGQAGVGKTALALRYAAEIARNYPDGQVYLDMKGSSESPMPARDAMARIIHSFDPRTTLPDDAGEVANLYRSTLHGKRVLLFLDDARDSSQIKPLAPAQGCALLVTSRRAFLPPGLTPIRLNRLRSDEAAGLLLSIEPRIQEHAAAIARLCGYLPLALELAASRLAVEPIAPSDFVRRLANERKRLGLLKEGDVSVEASIRMSYDMEKPESRRLWRILGIFPDTFDKSAAADIWELGRDDHSLDEAQDGLSALVRSSMVERDEKSERYRLHDLMRDFARASWEADESDQAGRRLSRHFLAVLQDAASQYDKGGDSLLRGLKLFDLEWPNIETGQAWAASHLSSHPEAALMCKGYAAASVYLSPRLNTSEEIRFLDAALQVARSQNDRQSEMHWLDFMSRTYRNAGEYKRALQLSREMLECGREMNDQGAQATALQAMGYAQLMLSETNDAIECYQRALALSREIRNPDLEWRALQELGNAFLMKDKVRTLKYYVESIEVAQKNHIREGILEGRRLIAYSLMEPGGVAQGVEVFEELLRIAEQTGDEDLAQQGLRGMAKASTNEGDLHGALQYLQRTLDNATKFADRREQAVLLTDQSEVYEKLGDRKRALARLESALVLYRGLGNPAFESDILYMQGKILRDEGDLPRAIDLFSQAAAIQREFGRREAEAFSYLEIGKLRAHRGELDEAIKAFECARSIFHEMESESNEAELLKCLGDAWLELDEKARAIECFEQSLTIQRNCGDLAYESRQFGKALVSYQRFHKTAADIGSRAVEADGLYSMGICRNALDDHNDALELLDRAAAIQCEVADRPQLAETLWARADTLHKLGRSADAIADATKALQIFEEFGDNVRAQEVQQSLQEWTTSTAASTFSWSSLPPSITLPPTRREPQ
jgi:tetratricopeptide (TPR) repeat protein